ncbi:MAG: dienelactone hydrolase family protein [Deltaproteobacteria bacterium]|nr:dienelactone hydrolase family protein [Deltaproteobacteria bacterium]
MSIQTEELQITTQSGAKMGAYLAGPDSPGRKPAVLVFMEIFGVNDHIRDVTRRVAAEGYVAIAPDYFFRSAPGVQLGYDEQGMNTGIANLMKLEADEMISDARDTLAYLRGRSDVEGTKIGAMGFCIGGHMTYLVACETDIVAAASYYGGGIAAPQGPGGAVSTLSRTPKIKGRIQCYFGAKDAMIPLDQVDAVKKALAAAGVDHSVEVYGDADHGFHCDQRASYHAPSAKDAWSKTLAMFDRKLKGKG